MYVCMYDSHVVCHVMYDIPQSGLKNIKTFQKYVKNTSQYITVQIYIIHFLVNCTTTL